MFSSKCFRYSWNFCDSVIFFLSLSIGASGLLITNRLPLEPGEERYLYYSSFQGIAEDRVSYYQPPIWEPPLQPLAVVPYTPPPFPPAASQGFQQYHYGETSGPQHLQPIPPQTYHPHGVDFNVLGFVHHSMVPGVQQNQPRFSPNYYTHGFDSNGLEAIHNSGMLRRLQTNQPFFIATNFPQVFNANGPEFTYPSVIPGAQQHQLIASLKDNNYWSNHAPYGYSGAPAPPIIWLPGNYYNYLPNHAPYGYVEAPDPPRTRPPENYNNFWSNHTPYRYAEAPAPPRTQLPGIYNSYRPNHAPDRYAEAPAPPRTRPPRNYKNINPHFGEKMDRKKGVIIREKKWNSSPQVTEPNRSEKSPAADDIKVQIKDLPKRESEGPDFHQGKYISSGSGDVSEYYKSQLIDEKKTEALEKLSGFEKEAEQIDGHVPKTTIIQPVYSLIQSSPSKVNTIHPGIIQEADSFSPKGFNLTPFLTEKNGCLSEEAKVTQTSTHSKDEGGKQSHVENDSDHQNQIPEVDVPEQATHSSELDMTSEKRMSTTQNEEVSALPVLTKEERMVQNNLPEFIQNAASSKKDVSEIPMNSSGEVEAQEPTASKSWNFVQGRQRKKVKKALKRKTNSLNLHSGSASTGFPGISGTEGQTNADSIQNEELSGSSKAHLNTFDHSKLVKNNLQSSKVEEKHVPVDSSIDKTSVEKEELEYSKPKPYESINHNLTIDRSQKSAKQKRKGKKKGSKSMKTENTALGKKTANTKDPILPKAFELYSLPELHDDVSEDVKLRIYILMAKFFKLEDRSQFLKVNLDVEAYRQISTSDSDTKFAQLDRQIPFFSVHLTGRCGFPEAKRRIWAFHIQVMQEHIIEKWEMEKGTASIAVQNVAKLLRVHERWPVFYDTNPKKWDQINAALNNLDETQQKQLSNFLEPEEQQRRIATMFTRKQTELLKYEEWIDEHLMKSLMRQGVSPCILNEIGACLDLGDPNWVRQPRSREDYRKVATRLHLLMFGSIPQQPNIHTMESHRWYESPVRMYLLSNEVTSIRFETRLKILAQSCLRIRYTFEQLFSKVVSFPDELKTKERLTSYVKQTTPNAVVYDS
ncbi:hypothetical protein CROQUDRAFT_709842 [Cronartium quercuum f. sp. fusiforme G11]|uniref:Uncharacterized protein n=1 Tax=Cronartium quercuum f. sp. fusiforme G11 TaxID=708437 RepID=A0A9P6NHX8_9BASI|nr:hypothetical protein CROQUDRAFT_709842 [Cronartium quercuum f. sp. fusiforme G11]